MGYRISRAAELSGVPATTIRYYEDQGLIRPAARAANGYRTYDDRDVARLRFVSRARALDLPIDDLAELVELWEGQQCAPVAQRLRDQVADRLTDTQQRIASLAALAGELQQVLARLQDPPHDGPCVEGECVCLDAGPAPANPPGLPLVDGTDSHGHPIACTLAPDQMPGRMDDWHQLLDLAVTQEPVPDGVSLRFPPDPNVAAELTRLAAAEHDCCSFFDFHLHVTADAVALRVTGPADAQPVIAAVFGASGPLTTAAH